MTTLILFGAGASCFCGDNTIIPSPPPLGCDLFEELSSFISIQKNLPASVKEAFSASRIPPDISEMFREDFEQGMEMYINYNKNESPLNFMKGMAAYFLQFQHNTLQIDQNFYVRFFRNLLKDNKQVVFSSLNYETLLEDSAYYSGIKAMCYGIPQRALNLQEYVRIIKPHGSANFLPIDTGNNIQNLKLFDVGINHTGLGAEIKPRTRAEALALVSNNNMLFTPAMSRYMAGKKADVSYDYIGFHRDAFKQATSSVARILIIGVRYNALDVHIWQPLEETDAVVGYVDPNEGKDFKNWVSIRENKKRKTCKVARTFEECFIGRLFSKNMSGFFQDKLPQVTF